MPIMGDRVLSELEQETSDAYEYVLDQIPNGRAYDRVSVHNAFPELQAAFDKCLAAQTYYRLTKDYNDEPDNDA